MSGRRIHLPSLSRGWKVVRNLLLTAVILVLFWGKLEYPMPSRELAFRRAEQAAWMGPSQLQMVGGSQWEAVGTCQDQVLIQTGKYILDIWPRKESGPTLVPCYGAVLAVDVPRDTASAQLEVCLEAASPASRPLEAVCMAEGVRQEAGGILFSLPQAEEGTRGAEMEEALSAAVRRETDRTENPACRVRMEAVFYSETGGVLARAELATENWEGGR